MDDVFFKMEWIKDHKLDARQNWMNVTLARAYDAAHTGNLMLCELTVGATRIAACLNFVTDKCLDGYMMALDNSWRACARES